jgi:hypothetical protein
VNTLARGERMDSKVELPELKLNDVVCDQHLTDMQFGTMRIGHGLVISAICLADEDRTVRGAKSPFPLSVGRVVPAQAPEISCGILRLNPFSRALSTIMLINEGPPIHSGRRMNGTTL